MRCSLSRVVPQAAKRVDGTAQGPIPQEAHVPSPEPRWAIQINRDAYRLTRAGKVYLGSVKGVTAEVMEWDTTDFIQGVHVFHKVGTCYLRCSDNVRSGRHKSL